jgi:hypothetical protein
MRQTVMAALLLLGALPAMAQTREDMPITPAQRDAILDGAARKYDSLYVFADRGRDISKRLTSKAVRARYADCALASCIADRLTGDLQSWTGDKHLRLVYSVQPRPMKQSSDTGAKARALESMRQRNYGFHNVERLHGNVGLLEIGRFDPAPDAAATAAAAMQFLANTDALIIDLRNNGGGHADMVAHLMSYFVAEQTHLATMKRRNPVDDVQFWSAAYVQGERYLNKPIYVLTGKRTFSAAEGLTYNLQEFAGAIVVGEPTRGGAHPGDFQMLNEHFAVFVPTGRTVNAKTGSNWEGVGIKVDHQVPAADAQKRAYQLALQQLVRTQDKSPRVAMWRQALDEQFPESKAAAQ